MWNLANTIDRDLYEHVKFICQWSRTGKDVKLIRQWSGMGKEIFGRILMSLYKWNSVIILKIAKFEE